MRQSLRTFVRSRSLRERITAIATALFAFAVAVGAILLIALQQQALLHASDNAAMKAAQDVAALSESGHLPKILLAGGGDTYIQVVDEQNRVRGASLDADHAVSLLNDDELARARAGDRFAITGGGHGIDATLRIVAVPAGNSTVIVASSMAAVERSIHLLRTAAVFGSPFGVFVMALVTYWIVGQTLAPVAALRSGAEEITAAGLRDQRLPVPVAQDEIHRLALTLNAMLDRLDSAAARQRGFVGDAAHELRSPIASARLQLEVAQRLGDQTDWNEVADDVLVDIDRLQRLVDDLLVLARLDETAGSLRARDDVDMVALVAGVVASYTSSRVPVRLDDASASDPSVPQLVHGDPDALRRVVVNLVDNAVRHARREVVVSVSTTTAPRPSLVLVVGDDGPGIAAQERQRVFDRFYRVAESRSRDSGGTGLGLAIVRDLVRAHGGSITLSDNPADGAEPATSPGLRACVTLPTVGEN